jgi:NADH-quinone oxidoreductase subunit N
VLGVLASVVAAYYYVRIVKVMYFDEGTETLDQPVFGAMRAVAFSAAILIALFSLAPQPLSLVAAAAAKGLFP